GLIAALAAVAVPKLTTLKGLSLAITGILLAAGDPQYVLRCQRPRVLPAQGGDPVQLRLGGLGAFPQASRRSVGRDRREGRPERGAQDQRTAVPVTSGRPAPHLLRFLQGGDGTERGV